LAIARLLWLISLSYSSLPVP